MVYNWTNYILSALYPANCLLCGTSGHKGLDICPDCNNDLPLNRFACERCALPLPTGEPQQGLCGTCQRDSPPFDTIQAPYLYQHPLDHLIAGFKFRQQLPDGRLLARLMAEHLEPRIDPAPQCIVPVPLHHNKLRERGFNQSAELARHLARSLGLNWSPDLLHKTSPTVNQHGLNRLARRKNLKGCFRFENKHQYRHIALVDDIVTTGATVAEIARVLKKTGVARVDVWAIARTPVSSG